MGVLLPSVVAKVTLAIVLGAGRQPIWPDQLVFKPCIERATAMEIFDCVMDVDGEFIKAIEGTDDCSTHAAIVRRFLELTGKEIRMPEKCRIE